MIDKKNPYEVPETKVTVVKIDGGILQNSIEANREGYGNATRVVW